MKVVIPKTTFKNRREVLELRIEAPEYPQTRPVDLNDYETSEIVMMKRGQTFREEDFKLLKSTSDV